RHRDRAAALAAEPAARVLTHDHHLRRIDPDPARHRLDRADDALRGAVQIEHAVLPVGHRAARFHRVMAGGLPDDGLVEDEGCVPEAGVEITELPRFGRSSHREAPLTLLFEILFGPLDGLNGGACVWRGSWSRRDPDVSLDACVRAAGPQAVERIDR